jgi:hypothetical protein
MMSLWGRAGQHQALRRLSPGFLDLTAHCLKADSPLFWQGVVGGAGGAITLE